MNKEILKLIEKIWKENPTLRFCQLIGNCFEAGRDPYYVSDEELLKLLKDNYKD